MTPVAKDSLEPGCAELLAENELDLDVQHLALSLSVATSAKRTADALERIAGAFEVANGLQMVLNDGALDERPNTFAETVCSMIAARLKR